MIQKKAKNGEVGSWQFSDNVFFSFFAVLELSNKLIHSIDPKTHSVN